MTKPYSLLVLSLRDAAFPISETRLAKAYHHGSSLWGKIAKLVTKLADGKSQNYFLKVRVLLCPYVSYSIFNQSN